MFESIMRDSTALFLNFTSGASHSFVNFTTLATLVLISNASQEPEEDDWRRDLDSERAIN